MAIRRRSLARALKARGIPPSDLARQLKVNPSTITRWMQGKVPPERVLSVETLTGISRHDLRPDIYPVA